jgi:hypothetical protein
MEPEVSLPYSQVSAIYTYPEPDASTPHSTPPRFFSSSRT